MHVLVVGTTPCTLFGWFVDGPGWIASGTDMPLQIRHVALGFLTSRPLRTRLSFVSENTAVGAGFVSGWEEPPGDQVTLCVVQTHQTLSRHQRPQL